MKQSIIKNYTQTDNKLQNNFEDIKYLIALHLQILEKLETLNKRVDRLYTHVDSIYGDNDAT